MMNLGPNAVGEALGGLVANAKEQTKAYIKAADHLQYTWLADGMVQVNVTHSNLKQFVQELRLDLHLTVYDAKRKLYTHNGSAIGAMELHLLADDGRLLAKMLDDDRMLGFYGVANGMTIHVVDTDPFSLSRDGGLDDVSKVEKYRMSEEEYDKREKTFRSFKKTMLAGNPNWKPVHAGAKPAAAYADAACVPADVVPGARCTLPPGDRRGEVAFVGPVPGLTGGGFWVGVRLDEPYGRHDGTAAGVRYFDAPDKYGTFVRPDILTCGNYPPLGLDELDEEGEGEEM